mmetsp:Transcript_6620/g.21395  ORF Transcript_6620/g.21395 Transcript_6620/m.21395 type:complete len:213 (+) Transcript_6620:485-1123(+)
MTPPAFSIALTASSKSSPCASSPRAETTTRRKIQLPQTLSFISKKGSNKSSPAAGNKSKTHQTSMRPRNLSPALGKSAPPWQITTDFPTAEVSSISDVNAAASRSAEGCTKSGRWAGGQPTMTVFGRKNPMPLAWIKSFCPWTTDSATTTSAKPSTPRSRSVALKARLARSAFETALSVTPSSDTITPFTSARPRPLFISCARKWIMPACGT